jgi:galactokinase
MNVGIGSSAAVEMGARSCLKAYPGLNLPPAQLARLGQMSENHVVGAPCGIMDQMVITMGRQGCLTHILCRPGEVKGEVAIPPGTAFVGINSMVRRSIAGNPYGDTRIGAFIGKKIINEQRARSGRGALDYLTELSVEQFRAEYARALPEEIRGSDFLARYKTHGDPVTKIQPETPPTAWPGRRDIRSRKTSACCNSWTRCAAASWSRPASRSCWCSATICFAATPTGNWPA